ncbi:MAG: transcriptional regulator NrdR [Polyangiales bacterium]
MKCPHCGVVENKVIDSRLSTSGEVTRRRRECEGCTRRYTTYERVEDLLPVVLKRDGRREPWDRTKLLQGLRRACEKRPVATEQLDEVADAIEKDLQELEGREVPTAEIGERVMQRLRVLDLVAYVRFAWVYRRFDDICVFVHELQRLTERAGAPSDRRMVAAAPVVATAEARKDDGVTR